MLGTGFVICSRHNTRRKINYCEQLPIYNADHIVVGSTFVCREDSTCGSSAPSRRGPNHADSQAGLLGAAPDGATSPLDVQEDVLVLDASSSRQLQEANTRHHIGGADSQMQPAPGETLFSVRFTHTNTNEATAATTQQAKQHKQRASSESESGTGEEEGGDSRGETEDGSGDDDGEERSFPRTTALSATVATPPAPQSQPQLLRGTPRYYDVAGTGDRNATAGGAGRPGFGSVRKVCWNCGLGGHEKPDCPNTLCRMCHDLRTLGQYHLCTEVRSVSPLLIPPASLPFTYPSPQISPAARSDRTDCGGFDAVRCLRCGYYGHMDCGPTSTKGLIELFAKQKKEYASLSAAAAAKAGEGGSSASALGPLSLCGVSIDDMVTFQRLSCNFCGGSGHSSYDCNQRDRVQPDRWVERNLMFLRFASKRGAFPANREYGSGSTCTSYPEDRRGGGGGGGDRFGGNNRGTNDGGGDSRLPRHSPSSPPHSPFPLYSSGGDRPDRRRPREEEEGRAHRRHDGNSDGNRWARNHNSGGSSGPGHSVRDRYHTSQSQSYYSPGGTHHHRENAYPIRSENRPRDYQGRSRRGGRSGCSGYSDEDDLY